MKAENYSESYTTFLRFDHKEERLKKVLLSSCGRDMLLVTEDEHNFDNVVVCNGRCRSDMPGAIHVLC